MDSSISNTNTNCLVPERSALPSLQTIFHCFPLRSSCLVGFSLDVKAAHKTIRVRAKEQGLLGVRIGDRFFFKVCPFGARFSAYWFARLDGFLLRMMHKLVYIPHFLALYVDDLLGFQSAQVVELSFALVLAFCATFHVPLSLKKLQLGFHIRWIGWNLHLRAGAVSIPTEKLAKLKLLLSTALSSSMCDRVTLHKICGTLQWLFKMFPLAKPWLRTLYMDLNRPPGTNISVLQGNWKQLLSCLSDTLHFTFIPQGMAVSLLVRLATFASLASASLFDYSGAAADAMAQDGRRHLVDTFWVPLADGGFLRCFLWMILHLQSCL